MERFTKNFAQSTIRVIEQENEFLYSVHDVADALQIEDPRREVMIATIYTEEDLKMVSWPDTHNITVGNYKFLINLALKAPETVTREFLDWLVRTERQSMKIINTTATLRGTDNQEDTSMFATTQIAKKFGISAQKLNEILETNKIQYKVNKQWVLSAEYQNVGFNKVLNYEVKDGKVVLHTYWTNKGRVFVEDLLRKLGYTEVPRGGEKQLNLF